MGIICYSSTCHFERLYINDICFGHASFRQKEKHEMQMINESWRYGCFHSTAGIDEVNEVKRVHTGSINILNDVTVSGVRRRNESGVYSCRNRVWLDVNRGSMCDDPIV